MLEPQYHNITILQYLRPGVLAGGGGGPGLPADTETTGQPLPGTWRPHFPRPRTRARCGPADQLLRNQPVNLQLLQIWSKPETFSDVNITTANTAAWTAVVGGM